MNRKEIQALSSIERMSGYLKRFAALADVGARLRKDEREEETWTEAEEAEFDAASEELDGWYHSLSNKEAAHIEETERTLCDLASGIIPNQYLFADKYSEDQEYTDRAKTILSPREVIENNIKQEPNIIQNEVAMLVLRFNNAVSNGNLAKVGEKTPIELDCSVCFESPIFQKVMDAFTQRIGEAGWIVSDVDLKSYHNDGDSEDNYDDFTVEHVIHMSVSAKMEN